SSAHAGPMYWPTLVMRTTLPVSRMRSRSADPQAVLEDRGHPGEVLDVPERVGVEDEEIGGLADLHGSHVSVQTEQPRGVPRHHLEGLHGREPGEASEMDVVLEVAELGVEGTGVASERHAVHQPEVAQRADDRQEVIEVMLEIAELGLFAGGEPGLRS